LEVDLNELIEDKLLVERCRTYEEIIMDVNNKVSEEKIERPSQKRFIAYN
jgi:hypothetical protein